MKNKLRILTLAILFHASSSLALPMDYSFDVDWTSGPLSVSTDTVFVTLDGVIGTGPEVFGVGTGLLAFDLSVGGDVFSIADVAATGLSLTLVDGVLTRVGGVGEFNVGQLRNAEFSIIGFIGSSGSVSIDDNNDFTSGSGGGINFSTFTTVTVVPVPSPATLALFVLGLVGLGVSRRKRKIHG